VACWWLASGCHRNQWQWRLAAELTNRWPPLCSCELRVGKRSDGLHLKMNASGNNWHVNPDSLYFLDFFSLLGQGRCVRDLKCIERPNAFMCMCLGGYAWSQGCFKNLDLASIYIIHDIQAIPRKGDGWMIWQQSIYS
jgi:hypothetical protein